MLDWVLIAVEVGVPGEEQETCAVSDSTNKKRAGHQAGGYDRAVSCIAFKPRDATLVAERLVQRTLALPSASHAEAGNGIGEG